MKDALEMITLVDLDDEVTGYASKDEAHRNGLLHRAFSIYIVNGDKMLIQKRNPDKYHSGGLWTNACCSHPRKGEELREAAHRRLKEEMGFDCALQEQFDFIYRTAFGEDLYEYEFDHVFLGRFDGEAAPDPEEASGICWISLDELKKSLIRDPQLYTSWFIISAPRIIKIVESGRG